MNMWDDPSFRTGFDEARSDYERIGREMAATPGAVKLSTLKVGNMFERIGEAEWYHDGRKAIRHTITEIIVNAPYANKLKMLPNNDGYYACLPGGITDEWVLLVKPEDMENE